MLEKEERGSLSVAIATKDDTNIHLVRWKDNSVVTVASTIGGTEVKGTARRWNRVAKKYDQFPIPECIKKYNSNMGGVDLMDQNINTYRISIRDKKWWWSIFTWMVDVSIHNA